MKTLIKISLLICFPAFLSVSINAQDDDVYMDTIVAKYFKAIGQDNINKIETAVATGTTLQFGQETSFRQIQKRPDKAYMEVLLADGQIIKQGYNGISGWMLASWMNAAEPVELVGPDLKTIKDMGNIEGDLWNWREKGYKLNLAGKQDMAGKQVYQLSLTKADGDIDEMYIDANSYLLSKMIRKTSINNSEAEVEVFYDDYRNIDGILLPFQIEQRFNSQQGTLVTIKEIRFNIEVDDKIFDKPE
jgi:outer membrane lipoprotein-sorting protein